MEHQETKTPTTKRFKQTQSFLTRLQTNGHQTNALRQIWNWVIYDSTFWKDEKRQRFLVQHRTCLPQRFRIALFGCASLSRRDGQLYILLGCPESICGVKWQPFIVQYFRSERVEQDIQEIVASNDARLLMGARHVLLRLHATSGFNVLRHCCLPVADSFMYDSLFEELAVHCQKSSSLSQKDGGWFHATHQSNTNLNLFCEADFKDFMQLGWQPAFENIMCFPSQWLNVLLPMIYKQLLYPLMQYDSFWNKNDRHANLIHNVKNKPRIHARVTHELKACNKEFADTKQKRRFLWKSYSPRMSSIVCALTPTVRQQYMDLLHRASPVQREKFCCLASQDTSLFLDLLRPELFENLCHVTLNSFIVCYANPPKRCHCWTVTNFIIRCTPADKIKTLPFNKRTLDHLPQCEYSRYANDEWIEMFPLIPMWLSHSVLKQSVGLQTSYVQTLFDTKAPNCKLLFRQASVLVLVPLLSILYTNQIAASTILLFLKRIPLLTMCIDILSEKTLRTVLSEFAKLPPHDYLYIQKLYQSVIKQKEPLNAEQTVFVSIVNKLAQITQLCYC